MMMLEMFIFYLFVSDLIRWVVIVILCLWVWVCFCLLMVSVMMVVLCLCIKGMMWVKWLFGLLLFL